MPKLYAVPMTLYIEAFNETMAAGNAELQGFSATEALRKVNSGWVTDNTTQLVTNGAPVEVSESNKELYNKEIMIKAFGEESAINFLNMAINKIHP